MPQEYETKIVLKNAQELYDSLPQHEVTKIEQFYLDDANRFRMTESDYAGLYHFYTFKKWIDGKLLEIETSIDGDDYELAKRKASAILRKDRFKVSVSDGDWDIDFLMTQEGQIYFALAEIETEPGAPWEVLPRLEPYVDLIVPREHSHFFTNSRLIDQEYAERVVRDYRAGCR